jgi:hypothetical protein
MLWDCFDLPLYNSSNTIIIDDLKRIKKIQPCNCYNIKPFEFTDEDSVQDNELKKLMGYLESIRKNPRPSCLIEN